MSGRCIIALLGKTDAPTDAVEEYCRYLGEALTPHGFDLVIERVAWAEQGWRRALRSLRQRTKAWRRAWVLVQYTALAWSARGFPLRFPQVLKILKAAGVHLGVVYHDVEPYSGRRLIDRLRRWAQVRSMREAIRLSDVAISTVPMEKLSWIKSQHGRTWFIPVGANFSTTGKDNFSMDLSKGGKMTIAVFGITGGEAGQKEIQSIVEGVRFAASQIKNLRLVVLGRNSKNAEAELWRRLSDTGIELQVMGLLSSDDVLRNLSTSDVLLFVRGPISTRRGSAIAGIACGLPVVACEGPETAPPITEAGLALYSVQRKGDLGDVLVRVLQDEHYRASLAQKSQTAQQQYFSWTAIAAKYAEFLKEER